MASRRKPAPDPEPTPAPVDDGPLSWTLEDLMMSPVGFRLATATPVQRALWRVLEGRPIGDELADHPRVIRALGGRDGKVVPEMLRHPIERPRVVYNVSGIRGAKTETIAGVAVRASQICDLSKISVGEVPRFSILSLNLDLARVAFNDHVVGKIKASPPLSALLLDEPTNDSLLLRHPSGTPIEVKVVAGARAGGNLVARWSVGMAADEAPRMHGDEAVINISQAIKAVRGRLLPGAQILPWGSPWAPEGPVYDVVTARWGKPGRDLVVVRAPAYDLNPIHWTPEECARLLEDDEEAHTTDVEAEFADAESAMFPSVEVQRACRVGGPADRPSQMGRLYIACIDPATRGNAWTLVVGHEEQGRLVVDLAREWVGSTLAPLDPREVFPQIRDLLLPYRLSFVYTDQLGFDFVAALASFYSLTMGLRTWGAGTKVQAFDALRRRLSTDTIELPDDRQLRADLIAVRRRPTGAGVSIVMPIIGGRHCDYAPTLAMLAAEYMPKEKPPPRERTEVEEAAQRKADLSKPRPKGRHWMSRAAPRFR